MSEGWRPARPAALGGQPQPAAPQGRARSYAFYQPQSASAAPAAAPPLSFDFPEASQYRNDRIFGDFGAPKHDEGWKIHVPFAGDSFDPYGTLLSRLREAGVPHKYVRDPEALQKMAENPTQKGKFLTIYPDGADQFKQVEGMVKESLPEQLPAQNLAPYDRPRYNMSYRYGGLTGPKILKKEVFEGKIDPTNEKAAFQDDVRDVYKPEHIKDPFDPGAPGRFDGVCDHYDYRKARYLEMESGGAYNTETLRWEKSAQPESAATSSSSETAKAAAASGDAT